MKNDIILVPFPQVVELHEGLFRLENGQVITIQPEEAGRIAAAVHRLKQQIICYADLDLNVVEDKNSGASRHAVEFVHCDSLSGEDHYITITQGGIKIGYAEPAGAFHAVSTLKQLIKQYKTELPCMEIHDSPDFKNRGIMLDISRNKIPQMDTLFGLIDFMADLKLNQLQLYIEGFSFAYPSFPEAVKDGSPVTCEELKELGHYCSERFIDLVPNQNSFGHMEAWLAREEFRALAECEEGFSDYRGVHRPAGTLDPQAEGSIELVQRMTDDLLPCFTSEYFNVGCDETYELGKGKSRDISEKQGTGRVYLDYLMKIYKMVTARNKKMMFWGDIINQYPELVQELPKDAIAMEWGYEAEHPFEGNLSRYRSAGVPFYVCPGTSSWCSISGRVENMKANLLNAAVYGKKYGAQGYLTTDWGDYGHMQYQPISYPGFVYGASLSWNLKGNIDIDIGAYLDEFIFMDEAGAMTQIIKDLGNYYLLEKPKAFNRTSLGEILCMSKFDEKVPESLSEPVLQSIEDYVGEILGRIDTAHMQCSDADIINREMKNACRMILHGVKLSRLKILLQQKDRSRASEKKLTEMKDDISSIIEEHQMLWRKRNRPGGLEKSTMVLERLRSQYDNIITR